MNKVYRDIVLARVQAAVYAAEAMRAIGHRGLRGQLREIVIRDLFRPLVNADIGFGTGEIVSKDGQQSGQQDIIMCDRRILSPIVLEQNTGVFPIESVLYVIEVKSILTAGGLEKSHRNAVTLGTFRYASGRYDDRGQLIPSQVGQLVYTVFAFGTNLKAGRKNDLTRYLEICREQPPPIRAICVVGNGYWWWSEKKGWQEWEHSVIDRPNIGHP